VADPTALFSVAEARAFDQAQLASSTTYLTATIEAAEAEIREQFEQICGVSFIPKTETDVYLDGTGTRHILFPNIKLISLESCVIYDSEQAISETFDADDISDVALYDSGKATRRSDGVWTWGEENVKVTYKHGYTAVPYAIKRAALIVLLDVLVASNVGDRTTFMSDGSATFSLATAGRNNQWYGIPYVDSVLQQYQFKAPGIA
jgi:hypothetical protein